MAALFEMQRNSTGAAANVEHAAPDTPHALSLVWWPRSKRGEVGRAGRRSDEAIVPLDDLHHAALFEAGGQKLPEGIADLHSSHLRNLQASFHSRRTSLTS